ncbi:MAG: UvrD-helicase domain-containing protein [Prevotellaceae bacterium]|jgi:ATP-dependent exoDNAse (exonuclease V) beta subunit|nr:UvrD-helicase domain-containing protein [Prevotellaceae bacterium]
MNKPVQLDLFSNFSAPNELTVYGASAGSGKTYTLTMEYLKQALSDGYNANKFRTVLAVTFTNKATDEMKSRIITTLNNIVNDRDSTVSDSICRELNINKRTLKDRATSVQQAILHNYSNFSISTIDKFFQRVVHAFVREAGLRPGFRLELDYERLMDEAIDRMMMNLHKKDYLYSRISNIIDEQMEKGRSWDIRKSLKNKGKMVLEEQFRTFGERFHSKIKDTAFIDGFMKEMNEIINAFEKSLTEIANMAISLIAGYEISDFNYGKSGPINYFYKLKNKQYEEPGKRVENLLADGNDEAWCSSEVRNNIERNGTKNEILQIAGQLTSLLTKAVTFYEQNHHQYFTAKCVKQAMDSLIFFNEIETNIREIANDENLLPISETTHLLKKLINESDTPFIYEMTGSRYNTFMIDEFQDTSEAQWQNFKPLLKNSLSEGKSSLVVGDVKQSIYRWRNGDWSILANRIFEEFSNFNVNEKNLDTNWRSFPNVIEFNNALFSALPAYIEREFSAYIKQEFPASGDDEINILSSAYKNVRQKISPANSNKSGYVAISQIRDEKDENGVKIKARSKILEQLPTLITDMQDRGYRASDIAILVRKAGEGQEISDCLLNYKKTSGDTKHCFDIMSKDALILKKSATVQFIIALMRAIINPDDKINNAAINYFQSQSQHQSISVDRSRRRLTGIDFADTLNDDIKKKLLGLTSLSLPEIFERLIKVFDLGNNPVEIPYIQELHDMLISFANNEISDISSFVEYWDDKSDEMKLSEGQTPDAINILTVHKAKGLEFPVVIIPFCDWKMKPDVRTTIWVSPSEEPFNQLPHVLVNYGKEMKNSYFATEYTDETKQSLVDNLNLLYVAFTRAKEELHVMLPLPALSKNNDSKADIIGSASSTVSTFMREKPDFMSGKLKCIRTGREDFCYSSGEKQCRQNSIVSEKRQEILIENYNSSSFDKKLRLKYESENYFPEQDSPLQLRNYGILMHRVFSLVRSMKDVPAAIASVEKDGLIGKEELAELKRRVEKALRFAGQWFADDSDYEVINEKVLLLPSSMNRGLSRRPDRIMSSANETVLVDYKFGALKKDSHKTQVKNYMQLLEMMKYPNIKGYVWYVDMDTIEEVKS